MTPKNIIIRAFELAQTGQVATMAELREALRREGYHGIEGHFEGRPIQKQLRALIDQGRSGSTR